MLRHELPGTEVIPRGESVEPTAATEAWQAVHEPAITLRVWLGEVDGMVNVKWAPEFKAAFERNEVPVEVGLVLALLHRVVHSLEDAAESVNALPALLAAMDHES